MDLITFTVDDLPTSSAPKPAGAAGPEDDAVFGPSLDVYREHPQAQALGVLPLEMGDRDTPEVKAEVARMRLWDKAGEDTAFDLGLAEDRQPAPAGGRWSEV